MILRIAWRYFKSKKNIQAITVISWVAVTAIAVATASLVIVLSIFNGFEGLVKDLYSSFYPDIRITHANTALFQLDSSTRNRIREVSGVQAISGVIETNAHLLYNQARTNATVKGVDNDYPDVSGLSESIMRGKYDLGDTDNPRLVLGAGVEYQLALESDRSLFPVTIYFPRKGTVSINPMEAVSVANIYPTGTFGIQKDFDNRYAITNIDIVQQMLGVSQQHYSALELRLIKGSDEAGVMQSISSILGESFLVENRYRQNKSLFAVMQLEKWVIYGVLTLILVLASFTMVGALTMLVLEKQQDIQILKAMGATTKVVFLIFLTEGGILALTGGAIGTLLAFLFCYLQVNLKIIPLHGAFVIDYYPVKIVGMDILLIFITILLIALFASWVPSYKASKSNRSLKAQ